MRPRDYRVRSGAFGPSPYALGILHFVRVRSVHCRAPLLWLVTFGSVRSIPELPGGRQVRSGAFGPFPSPLACRRVSSGAFGAFPCSLGVVVLVRSNPVRPRGNSGASVSVGSIRSILMLPSGVRFVRVRSVHFRAPWGSSETFGCVPSIPVHRGGFLVRSGAFGQFLRALRSFVCSVHSRAPWVFSGSFECVWSIPVRYIGVVVLVRVRSDHYSGNHRVHSGSRGINSCAPSGRQVHSGSRGINLALQVFAGFIQEGLSSLGSALVSPGSLWLA